MEQRGSGNRDEAHCLFNLVGKTLEPTSTKPPEAKNTESLSERFYSWSLVRFDILNDDGWPGERFIDKDYSR